MKSDARPLCGLCGESSPYKLKRSIYFFSTASTIVPAGIGYLLHAGQGVELQRQRKEISGEQVAEIHQPGLRRAALAHVAVEQAHQALGAHPQQVGGAGGWTPHSP